MRNIFGRRWLLTMTDDDDDLLSKNKCDVKTNNNNSIIKLSNVTCGYSYHLPVIEGVNLTVPKGRFLGLLGPSGSGKTTLLKIIAGLIKPWYGSVEFGDINENSYSHSNHQLKKTQVIGYVPQVESVDWTFPVTVREVVAMGIWNQSGAYPWLKKNAREEVNYILHSLGIGDYGTRQIRELSGGEQQRVFLARAMIRNPDILILDEPTSGVDYNTREKIFGILTELNTKGMTIILTTHDISGIGKRIPWVVCLNRTVVSEGPPQDTLTEANLLKTYGLIDTVSSSLSAAATKSER
jgi:ABC-type Mn2+/Zn2+ transport system ATPase subunit